MITPLVNNIIMRVLHIFNEVKYSGAEIMYVNAVPLFHDNGVEMIVLSTGNEIGEFTDRFRPIGVRVDHMKLLNGVYNPFFLFKYFKTIYNYIDKEKVDVIHIHRASYFWFFFISWMVKRQKNSKDIS